MRKYHSEDYKVTAVKFLSYIIDGDINIFKPITIIK